MDRPLPPLPLPPGLLSLPNELLFIILDDIEEPALLLTLALCSRRLHFCTIQRYLTHHGFPDPTSLHSLTLSSDSKILPALRISLFPTSIHHLRFRFSGNRFYVQVTQLERLLAKLVAVDELTLDFTAVDYWALTFPVKDQAVVFLKIWIRNFEALVDTALAKACLALKVCGGRVYPAASQSYGIVGLDDVVAYWRDKNSFILSLLHAGLDSYRGALGLPDLSVNKSPSILACLHIHSPMLLHPTLSFWTLHILNNSPITDLSFMHIDLPSSSWDKLLSCITLPSLSYLSFAFCNISSLTLSKFLSRHRRVVSLNLGERLPAADDDMSISRRAAFGQLTSLVAPIDYIFQLLSPTGYLPHLRFLSVHTSIPSLRDLSIHTGIYTGRPPHHQSISDLISSAVARGTLLSMTLVLFADDDNWLDSLVDEGYIGDDHVLRDIVHLVVSARPELLSTRMIAQFPVWLASFPLLERIAFVTSPDSWELNDASLALIRSIRTRCGHVQSVILSGVEHSITL